MTLNSFQITKIVLFFFNLLHDEICNSLCDFYKPFVCFLLNWSYLTLVIFYTFTHVLHFCNPCEHSHFT